MGYSRIACLREREHCRCVVVHYLLMMDYFYQDALFNTTALSKMHTIVYL
jgi:hypothetical protein